MGFLSRLFAKPAKDECHGKDSSKAEEPEKRRKYVFRNPHYYSNKPVSELKGIILLTPEGEAEQIAKSAVFVGTIEDTAGTWINEIRKPIHAIGHRETRELFERANAGVPTALGEIITTGVNACLEKTAGIFPPAPVDENEYIVQAMPKNEKTGSCFLVLMVY